MGNETFHGNSLRETGLDYIFLFAIYLRSCCWVPCFIHVFSPPFNSLAFKSRDFRVSMDRTDKTDKDADN